MKPPLSYVDITMIELMPLLLAAATPDTPEWSPKVALVMIVCNIAAIAIGKFTIAQPDAGPALPAEKFFGS